jgi:UDP-N-acetylmuramoyl-L-alanyl-D-glutamate--2,6-diaminopimelate ligase
MSTQQQIEEPSEAEIEALRQAAEQRIHLARPTAAPFPWADVYTTVGITGTNGKTSTTRLVAAALEGPDSPVLCETTIGYEFRGEKVEVPRTLKGFFGALARAARLGARHAAIETTSQALQRGYAKMWRFDVGVFTNLSQDHLSQHGSWEHYLASKAQLFVHLGPGRTAVLNAADPSATLIDQVTPADVHRLWYGVPSRGPLREGADLAAHSIELSVSGTRVLLEDSPLAATFDGKLQTRLLGDVFAENLLAAACAAIAVGVPARTAAERLANCPRPAGRFEVVSEDPIVAIDYAHTPDALQRTCETARKLAGNQRLIVVFGAGGSRDREKRAPMGRAVGEQADFAVITNDNPRNEDPNEIAKAVAQGARKGGRAHVDMVLDRRQAIIEAMKLARPGDCVLIAGKGHEEIQEVGNQKLPFSDRDVALEALKKS